jgi:hypothetical protein
MLFLVSTDEAGAKYLWVLHSCVVGVTALFRNTNLPPYVTAIKKH